MTNFVQNFIAIIVPPLLYAVAYSIGGRDTAPIFRPRIWRRILAPVVLSASLLAMTCVIGNSASLLSKCLIASSAVTYILAMYLTKYGGDTLWQKVRGRVWSGFVVGIASFPIALIAQSWRLFALQVILAISAHLALGIKNTLPAHLEEFSISLATVLLASLMII